MVSSLLRRTSVVNTSADRWVWSGRQENLARGPSESIAGPLPGQGFGAGERERPERSSGPKHPGLSTSRGVALGVCLLALVLVDLRTSTAEAGEPSPEYRANLRRTLELRKQRRRSAPAPPVGVIVGYPMPPTLLIRQTPEAHAEIVGLLGLLRHGGR
jgi:hypothetical protein